MPRKHSRKRQRLTYPRITHKRGDSDYLIAVDEHFSCVCETGNFDFYLYPPWPTTLILMQGWWWDFEAPAGLVDFLVKYAEHLPRDKEWYGYGDDEFMREHGWYVPFPARPPGEVDFPGWGDEIECQPDPIK